MTNPFYYADPEKIQRLPQINRNLLEVYRETDGCRNNVWIVGVKYDGEPVSFCTVAESKWEERIDKKTCLYVTSLATDPRYRKHGLGMMVMGKIIEFGKEKGMNIHLDSSRAGMRLYEKIGFVKTHGVHYVYRVSNDQSILSSVGQKTN